MATCWTPQCQLCCIIPDYRLPHAPLGSRAIIGADIVNPEGSRLIEATRTYSCSACHPGVHELGRQPVPGFSNCTTCIPEVTPGRMLLIGKVLNTSTSCVSHTKGSGAVAISFLAVHISRIGPHTRTGWRKSDPFRYRVQSTEAAVLWGFGE